MEIKLVICIRQVEISSALRNLHISMLSLCTYVGNLDMLKGALQHLRLNFFFIPNPTKCDCYASVMPLPDPLKVQPGNLSWWEGRKHACLDKLMNPGPSPEKNAHMHVQICNFNDSEMADCRLNLIHSFREFGGCRTRALVLMFETREQET